MAATDPDAEPQTTSDQQYRAGAYSYLAALLRQAPTQETLNAVSSLTAVDDSTGAMETAMSLLGLAAESCTPEEVRDEYFALFIGLGRGEVVPFGSWYQTGFLMERPLGELRSDLKRLGFERDESVKEPEDHVAALFEVMAMLIHEGATFEQQAEFYNRHLAEWIGRFFGDLARTEAATFYKSVARFGTSFIELESSYLGMKA